MAELGVYVMPCMVMLIIGYGMFRGIPVFDVFLSGATDGMKMILRLLPTLVGLLTAVAMLKASGALDMLTAFFRPVASFIGLPAEVLPLALIHPISGGGATAVLTDIFQRYGPDSYIGRVGSILCGSGETTLYSVTVYFGAIGVTQTGHTLPVALLADVAVALCSGFAVSFIS